eukprot:TRINITY_DN7010_c0_g1_i20.p1 TRINITY_DN7010_c0_g1~~TRINITY_DN7010_c0_g1_i20.p1  ORF type:complete len:100 (-),score=36.82 TRINITY_DN7010_c0_g1_i20:161-460(-)
MDEFEKEYESLKSNTRSVKRALRKSMAEYKQRMKQGGNKVTSSDLYDLVRLLIHYQAKVRGNITECEKLASKYELGDMSQNPKSNTSTTGNYGPEETKG